MLDEFMAVSRSGVAIRAEAHVHVSKSRHGTLGTRVQQRGRSSIQAKPGLEWATVGFGNVVENQAIFGENEGMDKGRVIETLRTHRDELEAAGVVHLAIFGSVARGEASEKSDVDLMADFDRSKRLTLVKIGSLQQRLSDLLGAEVELSSADWMREHVRSRAMREAVLAF